ncbi:hypothetical protein, partial [Acidiphilium rubrum]|uniref:hypothetical protein n=2 Tax=Acidiphilium TaxID=522 RepID=UPI001C37CD11
PASGMVNIMIAINGTSDRDRPEWMIAINGIRMLGCGGRFDTWLGGVALMGIKEYQLTLANPAEQRPRSQTLGMKRIGMLTGLKFERWLASIAIRAQRAARKLGCRVNARLAQLGAPFIKKEFDTTSKSALAWLQLT